SPGGGQRRRPLAHQTPRERRIEAQRREPEGEASRVKRQRIEREEPQDRPEVELATQRPVPPVGERARAEQVEPGGATHLVDQDVVVAEERGGERRAVGEGQEERERRDQSEERESVPRSRRRDEALASRGPGHEATGLHSRPQAVM